MHEHTTEISLIYDKVKCFMPKSLTVDYTLKINLLKIYKRKRADNGGDYLMARCAGGRGNTTHTPEAGRN